MTNYRIYKVNNSQLASKTKYAILCCVDPALKPRIYVVMIDRVLIHFRS